MTDTVTETFPELDAVDAEATEAAPATAPVAARSRSRAPDAVLAAAVDLARDVLVTIAEPGTVGDHAGYETLEERLGMHWFTCLSPGYQGWRWGVSVARVPRGKVATVCETNLLPAADAVLAPEWLPYAERLAPGDLGAGDVLPFREVDPYLEAGFEATGEEDVDQVGFYELGLGRPRVLAAEGREAAASRWYAGDGGPASEVSTKASARCSSCGFFLPMAGALRRTFGVCANEWSPSDGRVISLDHGCGAHSETEADEPEGFSVGAPIVDELAFDVEVAERATPPATDGEQSVEEQPVEAGPVDEQHGSDDPVTD
ncbi:MAG: hypothetical protein JWP82_1233 [Humibacillus sp.]|nr:hypothetical protein [Humibacillus sp.]